MDYSEIEVCQNEIDSISEITKYFQRREASMAVVYDNLVETMTRSQDTCRILKDVKMLMDRTREVFFYLGDQEVSNTHLKSSHNPLEDKNADKPQVHNKDSTTDNSREEETERAESQSDKHRAPKKTTIPSEPQVLRKQITHLRKFSRNSMAPRLFKNPQRRPNPPIALPSSRPRSNGQQLQTRIRHNANYPKPWLDPPEKRNNEQNTQRQSINPSGFRRQSMAYLSQKRSGAVTKSRRSTMANPHQLQSRVFNAIPTLQSRWGASNFRPSQTEPLRTAQATSMLQRQPRRATLLPAARPTRVYRSSQRRKSCVQKLAKINEL